jgi:hypothetical protein
MSELRVVLLLACAASSACMTQVPETRALPPVEEEVLLPPTSAGSSVLRMHFDRAGDGLDGHLEWATTCRRALVVHPRWETRSYTVPNRAAAVAAGMGAVGIGSAGAMVLAHRDDFSDERSCYVDSEGEEQCASPREQATAGGVGLVGTAVALAAASVVTLASKPGVSSVELSDGPALPPRILEDGVACGEGPVAKLAVTLYRDGERIAEATTDEHGDVRFAGAERVGGSMTLKAEWVPLGYRMLRRGQDLGGVRVETEPAGPTPPRW